VSYAGEILHTDTRRSCEGHVLGSMSIKVVVTKNDIFHKNYLHVGVALLLIAQAAYGALAAYWAGVSQPSSLSLNQAVAAHGPQQLVLI